MSKITKIPSEIRNFFTGKRINRAFSKFMAVPGFSHYAGSSISKLFGGKKELLYSFMAKDNID